MSAADELESLGFTKTASGTEYEEWVRAGSIWDIEIAFDIHDGQQFSKISCRKGNPSPVFVTVDVYEAMIHRMRERDAE